MNIRKVDSNDGQILFSKIAEIYCKIWKEPPWNEDFWTVESVVKDLKEQSKRQNFVLLAALNGTEDIVGFTWGYEVNTLDLSKISGHPESIWKDIIQQKRCFYVDELGVDINHRGKKIGKKLTIRLLREISLIKINHITLRTDIKAVPARSLYQKVKFKEIDLTDKEHGKRTYWLRKD